MQLLNSQYPESTLVWHRGQPVSRAGFIHAAQQLAARLPDATHAINLCNGRLSFLLGFAAAALRDQVTLLPPNQTVAALQRLQQTHPEYHVLDDSCIQDLDWRTASQATLHIDAERIVATLFTSGSTGVPQPQIKTWQVLARTGALDAQRFVGAAAINLVATVPSQHMFGLQTTVLIPLMSRCAIHDSRPFFPADIREALMAVPAPRALITTPVHLRACVAGGIELPQLEFILSATAPMPPELAQQAEACWRTQVLEIYGSTEAGAMATRRSTAGDAWRLTVGARIEQTVDGSIFHAEHLPAPLPLTDHVELLSAQEFRLLGRASEQIKIAGKRASLSELTHALLKIPGISDGVVFMPQDATRTAALVVSDLQPAQILDALAECIDPVFLPRPLCRVRQLPRNAVGKLTQAALQTALTDSLGRSHG